MRVLGLIPARGGSRRTPGKNLAVLGGRTLVRRALETALASSCFEITALSSEDAAILAEAEGLEIVQLQRPPELAGDTALAADVVAHALSALDEAAHPFDAVAIVQCTAPFTAPEDIGGAVAMLERTGADSVVTVVRVAAALHPLKLKVLEGDRLLPWLEDDRMAPSQELPPLWRRNGSAYVSRRHVIERGSLVGVDTRGYEMPPERSFDIDTPEDLAFADFLMRRGTDAE